MREWKSERDLAGLLIARAHAGKHVRLSPDTALFVGVKLMTVAEKPTCREVARMLCTNKCEALCFTCAGKANLIVNAYGHSVEPPFNDAPSDAATPVRQP